MKMFCCIRNRRGSQLVEATLAMPVIILAMFLMLRMFTFYLQIMSVSVRMHEEALKHWNAGEPLPVCEYSDIETIYFAEGGLLLRSACKTIEVNAVFRNEDALVRAESNNNE